MRDPVNRPVPRAQRERAGLLALRDSARSRIRCAWRLGSGRLRHASPTADEGSAWGDPEKIHMAPCRTSSFAPTLSFACSRHPVERRLNSVRAPSLGSPATRATKILVYSSSKNGEQSNSPLTPRPLEAPAYVSRPKIPCVLSGRRRQPRETPSRGQRRTFGVGVYPYTLTPLHPYTPFPRAPAAPARPLARSLCRPSRTRASSAGAAAGSGAGASSAAARALTVR